ncbi:aminotransferase class III-fold pyridoxal phosphate-dependent enzyme [Serratia ureilytica]
MTLGHNHPDVLQSIQNVITSGLPLHTLDLDPVQDRFSDYLLSLLPGEAKNIACSSAARRRDAVEAALKPGEKHTGRSGVIGFSGGYHGATTARCRSPAAACLAEGGDQRHDAGSARFMPYPHEYRCPLGIGGGEAGVKT